MKSNMKKNLIKLGVMLAATFSLTNCTEEITTAPTPEVESRPYTIFANAPETKTVNDGLSTKWAENDSLNVSHVPSGTLDFNYNSRFDLVDVATGRFETECLEGEPLVLNDWYVLYPYNAKIDFPNTTAETDAWFPVGSKASGVQTQEGNNSMAHIAGPDYPMYGVAKEVQSDELPHIMMSHLSSLVEVKVTNNADAPAAVSSIMFTAPEDVVGTYYIDITSDVPTFTPSKEWYVSNIAILTVKDAEPLAIGESASFYFAIKPFTATTGSELTINVNGTEKTITLENDVTFSSGKIKTINFDYDEIIEPKESIEEGTYWITAELDGAEYYANAHAEGTNYGYLKADSEGFIDNAFTFKAVRGGGFTIQQADGRYLYLSGSYNSFNVSKELPAEGAVWNAYINDDGTHSIVNVDKLKTIYYSSSYNNYAAYSRQTEVDILPVLVNAEDAEERPVFTLSTTSINVEASATSVEFSIKSNLDWTISSEADVDINPESGKGDATVTVSFAANETDSPIKYVIVISTEEFGDRKVTITHAPKAEDIAATFTMIDRIADLKADTYYMAGYLESYKNGQTVYDWSEYPYHVCTGSSTDIYTANYSFAEGVLTKDPTAAYDAVDVILEAVEGKTDTYYIKVGDKGYLYSKSYANRKLAVSDEKVEWLATDHETGGITLVTSMSDGDIHLGTAGAQSNLIRSYKDAKNLKYGLVFFKKN